MLRYFSFAFILAALFSGCSASSGTCAPPRAEPLSYESDDNADIGERELGEEYDEQEFETREHDSSEVPACEEEKGHSVLHQVVLYIPNRLFDVLDIVRARVRVGPGLAVGARVTQATEVFAGGYGSVFLGLPGPRRRPKLPLPFGVESRGGAALSLIDATANTGEISDPKYSATEIGLETQLAILGFSLGIDPVEIVDLAAGLIFLDIRGDDL